MCSLSSVQDPGATFCLLLKTDITCFYMCLIYQQVTDLREQIYLIHYSSVNLTHLPISVSFLLGWLHPEHGVSMLSGADRDRTVRLQFSTGHSGLHRSEMDHHQHPDCPATVNHLPPFSYWSPFVVMDESTVVSKELPC